jgi:GNAT superfamily N-acetyltransferase
MIRLIRTDSHHPDFIDLVKLLDAYLKTTDGDEHDFYNQFNNIDVLKHVVIAYNQDKAIGCGAFKEFNNNSVEIKRMYTLPKTRGKGVATKILTALEFWAKETGYTNSILETGIRQIEAVNFYKKNSYEIIPSYGQYLNMENSVCFKKEL